MMGWVGGNKIEKGVQENLFLAFGRREAVWWQGAERERERFPQACRVRSREGDAGGGGFDGIEGIHGFSSVDVGKLPVKPRLQTC